jgi:hypothetical protein
MKTEHFYTPIIKGKLNDLKAIGLISPHARSLVKPMVEAMPVAAGSKVEAHLEKLSRYIVKHFPVGELFLDLYGLKPGAKTQTGEDAIMFGFRLIKSKGRLFTPTYGFERDDTLWPQLFSLVTELGQGFCFRIDLDDLDDKAEETWSQIIDRTSQLRLSPAEVDLVIDLRDIGGRDLHELRNLVVDFLTMKPAGIEYRSISLAGSSALKSVANIKKDTKGEVDRLELRLWALVQYELAGTTRLALSDYGVIHPEFSDANWNPNMQAKIRYTVGRRIIYFRGHNLRNPSDSGQYHTLAQKVYNNTGFQGRDYSVGDSYIEDCANFNTGPGNLGTWAFVDMNHHIEYTARQVESVIRELERVQNEEELAEIIEA